ncbi:MAG TPA: TldD/PmbA family protein [Methanocella sp.]|uniref:TldD/PmbA family protein n=1 Tax=Methanocella sp. TaxID=2052833 RepID=UPI002C7080F9|nr:TldD/PmbA family protein [Methanocella sp.]HTY90006.1 TldD/PmbA family protein [Methanocella sp.]
MNFKHLIDLALKEGATEAEIFYSKGRVVNVETQKGSVGFGEESVSDGIGIRVISGGAFGYSSVNDPGKYEDAVRTAVKCAKARGRDPSLQGLPGPKPYRSVSGIYDRRIDGMKLDECIDTMAAMVSEATKDRDVSVTFGKFSSQVSETTIINSNGIDAHEKDTAAYGYIDVILKKGDQVSTAYDYDVSRALDVNFAAIGSNAAELAKSSLNAVSIESKTCDVLLGPQAFSDVMEGTLLFAINSENVQKGRSSLADSIGKKVAVDGLAMVDDGLIPGGLGTSAFDDEGVPTQATTIIDDGVLETFIYDSYTAGKAGRESTGNAVRGTYQLSPKVGPHNVRFEYPRSDVIGETKKGIYVNSIIGAHTANPITGDFSVECRNSFIVEDGRKTKPIKSLMMGGNAFQFLNNITGMGRDDRKMGAFVVPTVRVKDVHVTRGSQ